MTAARTAQRPAEAWSKDISERTTHFVTEIRAAVRIDSDGCICVVKYNSSRTAL